MATNSYETILKRMSQEEGVFLNKGNLNQLKAALNFPSQADLARPVMNAIGKITSHYGVNVPHQTSAEIGTILRSATQTIAKQQIQKQQQIQQAQIIQQENQLVAQQNMVAQQTLPPPQTTLNNQENKSPESIIVQAGADILNLLKDIPEFKTIAADVLHVLDALPQEAGNIAKDIAQVVSNPTEALSNITSKMETLGKNLESSIAQRGPAATAATVVEDVAQATEKAVSSFTSKFGQK